MSTFQRLYQATNRLKFIESHRDWFLQYQLDEARAAKEAAEDFVRCLFPCQSARLIQCADDAAQKRAALQ